MFSLCNCPVHNLTLLQIIIIIIILYQIIHPSKTQMGALYVVMHKWQKGILGNEMLLVFYNQWLKQKHKGHYCFTTVTGKACNNKTDVLSTSKAKHIQWEHLF